MFPKQGLANQHVFETNYFRLCDQQNCVPVANVKKQLSKRMLDFVGDSVKLNEWSLILKGLRTDRSLKMIAIRSRRTRQTVLESVDTERKTQQLVFSAANRCVPVLFTKYMVKCIVDAVCRCIMHSEELTSVVLECIPLDIDSVSKISLALQQTKSIKELALPNCKITDEGCKVLCNVLRNNDTLTSLDLTGCDITSVGAAYICEVLEKKKLRHLEGLWQYSLRYNDCDLDAMPGLRRLTLNGNRQIGDDGIKSMCYVLMDDYQLKALDIQACGLTQSALEDVLKLIHQNETMQIVDIRGNNINTAVISSVTTAQKKKKIPSNQTQYPWLKEIPSNNRLVASSSSEKSVRGANEPRKQNATKKIQSDPTLPPTTSRNVVVNRAKLAKSCDTKLRGKFNLRVPNNSSHLLEESVSVANGKPRVAQPTPKQGSGLFDTCSISSSASSTPSCPTCKMSARRPLQPNDNQKSAAGGSGSPMPRNNNKYKNKEPISVQKINVPARMVAGGRASSQRIGVGSSALSQRWAVKV